jgi:hypothetical protein
MFSSSLLAMEYDSTEESGKMKNNQKEFLFGDV